MYSVFLDWVFIEDNSRELNQFITALNKIRKDLYFTILVPKNSHFTRQLDQFDNVEYVQDVENRFEEPGKEISAMPYISKYIYNKLNKLQKDTQTALSTKDKRVLKLIEEMRDSAYMTERWAATYNPANFLPVNRDGEKPRLFWRDWDVDLILSFHPAIILNHLDHFKKILTWNLSSSVSSAKNIGKSLKNGMAIFLSRLVFMMQIIAHWLSKIML